MMNMVNPMTLLATHLTAPQKQTKSLFNERKRLLSQQVEIDRMNAETSRMNAESQSQMMQLKVRKREVEENLKMKSDVDCR